jgi:DNA polymerase III subunit beta
MKITIQREPFLHAFQTAALVAPVRSPKTILQNIKLAASGKSVSLSATDTDIGIKLTLDDVQVDAPGEAVIPVNRLGAILRESTDESLVITADDRKVVIKGRHSRFELQGQNPAEFPDVSAVAEGSSLEIAASRMKDLIRKTLFATDAESSRYALSGVLLEASDDQITAVGTDGRRLARIGVRINGSGSQKESVSSAIVPSRAMQILERIVPDNDSGVQLFITSNSLAVRFDNNVFTTRLLEGRFPRWRDVIPTRSDSLKIDLPVGPLNSAVRQASIVANEESRGIDLTFGEGNLVISNNTAEVGQSRVELPVAYNEAPVSITLDFRYVLDFLKVLPPESTFTFDVADSSKAAYCETADGYGYVIMPLSRDSR